jgi:hypothetical protein
VKLEVYDVGGKRVGLATTPDGRFAGPDDLAACSLESRKTGVSQPSLAADLLAGR